MPKSIIDKDHSTKAYVTLIEKSINFDEVVSILKEYLEYNSMDGNPIRKKLREKLKRFIQ